MGNQALRQANQDLCQAVQRGDVQSVERLLRQNAQQGSQQVLNEVSAEHGGSPLLIAAKNARLDLVTLLLDASADLHGRDATQWTALHCAARTAAAPHCTGCVQLLLARRADAFAATELGSTPLDLARRSRCKSCVRALEAHAVLWQGWVDHEQKLLMIPTVKSKWLVLVRDRRHNTGPSLFARGDFHNFIKKAQHMVREHLSTTSMNHRCPCCGKSNPIPDFVETFRCEHCKTLLVIPTSLQLALYEAEANGDVEPEPSMVLPIPTDGMQLTMDGEKGGWLRKLLANSDRQHAMTISHTQDHVTLFHLSLRFSSSNDREELGKLLQSPLLRGRGLAPAEEYSSLLTSPAADAEELPIPSAPPADFERFEPSAPSVAQQAQQAHWPAAAQAISSTVAAAAPAAPAAAAPTAPTAPAGDTDDGLCVVCLEHPADTAVVPCGHLCGCHRCMTGIMAAERLCPVCRGEASSTMRIYRS